MTDKLSTPGWRSTLEAVAEALDKALGDTDITHIESDDELREVAPVQWACSQVNKLLQTPQSESERTGWIPCSDHARLPNCDDVESVLGWFPAMKEPKQVSPETVKHWSLDADPIHGAMWMPLPEAPRG